MARIFFVTMAIALFVAGGALAEDIHFISVPIDSDAELRKYFQSRLGVDFPKAPADDYSAAIQSVLDHEKTDQDYVARLTPYAYVVAELLGAQFETLATYQRRSEKTGQRETTYKAYFVVRQTDFPTKPTRDDIARYLRDDNRKFVYHDQLSTSSYFIPFLFFREHNILDTETGNNIGNIHAVDAAELAIKPKKAATAVRVVRGEFPDQKADIAAVWDKTVAEFSDAKDVWFVELDDVLPNDLLVYSKRLSAEQKRGLQQAVKSMNGCENDIVRFPSSDDVVCWSSWESLAASNARSALDSLREKALPQTPKVAVDVQYPGNADESLHRALAEAAKQAIRMAGTEFVVYENYHPRKNATWTIERVHDDMAKLTTTLHDFPGLRPESHFISFTDIKEDLPSRIAAKIRDSVSRVRYIWPFQIDESLIVLRDGNNISMDDVRIQVQQVALSDADSGDFQPTKRSVRNITLGDIELRYFKMNGTLPAALDPMSNVAYRVVISPSQRMRPFFRHLTSVLVGLFVLAAVAALLDLYRLGRLVRTPRMRTAELPAGTAARAVLSASD